MQLRLAVIILLSFLAIELVSAPKSYAEEGDFMDFYWGMKCSDAAKRFDGSGQGLIFKSDTVFDVSFMGEQITLFLGCVDKTIFSSGRLACGRLLDQGSGQNEGLINISKTLIKQHNKKYGHSTIRNMSDIGNTGVSSRVYEWTTSTTIISLFVYGDKNTFRSLWFTSRGMNCPWL